MCRELTLQSDLLGHNDAGAAGLRQRFAAAGVRAVNLLSSPGSGKTALLEAACRRLADQPQPPRLAAIVGDLATDNDAQRLRAAGLPAVAITTGQACHLESGMVEAGLHRLEHQGVALTQLDLLLIENVGNLVCPAAYDLGEARRVVLLAVTEGEDKPLKYPVMFREADCLLITKTDLAPYLEVDLDRIMANVRQINPGVAIFPVSAKTGEGLADWLNWVRQATGRSIQPATTQPGDRVATLATA